VNRTVLSLKPRDSVVSLTAEWLRCAFGSAGVARVGHGDFAGRPPPL